MALVTCMSLLFYSWAIMSGFKTEFLEQGQKVNDDLRSKEYKMESQLDKKNAI